MAVGILGGEPPVDGSRRYVVLYGFAVSACPRLSATGSHPSRRAGASTQAAVLPLARRLLGCPACIPRRWVAPIGNGVQVAFSVPARNFAGVLSESRPHPTYHLCPTNMGLRWLWLIAISGITSAKKTKQASLLDVQPDFKRDCPSPNLFSNIHRRPYGRICPVNIPA